MLKKIKGQVWIETVIYTLIGLSIIAILLTVATPQIEKIKDREITKQTMNTMNIINKEISAVKQSSGSIRIVELKIGKGRLEINSKENTMTYILENTRLELSQPGEEIEEGEILVKTEEYGSRFNIFLTLNYDDGLNITFNKEDTLKVLQMGTTPYKLQIENVGDNKLDEKTHIDFNLI